MKVSSLRLFVIMGAITGNWVTAQNPEVILIDRSHAIFQDGPNSSIPAGTTPKVDYESFYFTAGAEINTDSISNFRIAGPPAPLGEPIPYVGPDDGYALEQSYDTAQALADEITAGTYTFSGSTSTSGAFSENVYLPAYIPLTNRLITNYSALQSFDPSQAITIEWEPFLEGQGPEGGVIYLEISYQTYYGDQYVWSSDSITPPDAFGLEPTVTSVEIPAGTLTGSPNGKYFVGVGFVRIDTFDELGAGSAVEGTVMASITSMELFFEMQAEPDRMYLTPGTWIQTPRIINVFGYSEDWGFSEAFGLIDVSRTPHWFWQSNLGWLSMMGGYYPTGIWLYSPNSGYIYVKESWGMGVYWSDQAQTYLNMIDPGT